MATDISNDNEEENTEQLPSEIQKAVCTVMAGEVKASAEAVATKTLKGVCGSAEMQRGLEELQEKLTAEIQEIKIILQQLIGKNVVGGTINTTTSAVPTPTTPPSDVPKSFTFAPPIFQSVDTAEQRRPVSIPPKPVIKLKSLPSSRKDRIRHHEIQKFNNTLLTDQDLKIFSYFWKIENLTEHIEGGISSTLESPIFSIKGKLLQIKAYFQHLHRDFLYLQLEYAVLKTSNRNKIILDMGGIFKEISTYEKVHFKHKISILDQSNHPSNDLVSQEFHSLDNGFSIPNSALLASRFIKNNSLLIQLFLYL